MSFILDALKKSEAERQLGEVPSLQTAGDIHAPQNNKRSWFLPLIAVLIAAVILGWFWRHSGNITNDQVAGSSVEKATRQTEPVLAEQSPANQLPQIKQSPLANYSPPADAKTVTDGMDMPDTGKVISISETVADSDKLPTAAQTTGDNNTPLPAAVSEQQRIERLQKQRASERAEDEALVAAVEQRLASEKSAKIKQKKTTADKLNSNTVRLNELPPSVRSEIPDISISMQVYSSQPGSRFAIINGKRYVESDQLADSVILDEILRQGVVLKYRQYRILIQ